MAANNPNISVDSDESYASDNSSCSDESEYSNNSTNFNDSMLKCVVCAGPGTLHCEGCTAVRYCSRECCDANSRFHEHLCSTFKDFETAPNEHMFRALYLAPDEAKPRLLWAKKEYLLNGGNGRITDLLPGSELVGQTDICKDEYSGPLQERKLTMYYDEQSGFGSPVNKAIVSLAQGRQGFDWRGPIIVCAGKPGVSDFNMVDLRHLVTFLITYSLTRRLGLIVEHNGPKIQAVMMPCDGEKRLTGVIAPQSVMVPRLHKVWDGKQDQISMISQRIGIPLFVIPYLTKSEQWATAGDAVNSASYLHVNAFSPLNRIWDDLEPGNVLVARVDRKDLEADVAEAMLDYCRHHVTAIFTAGVMGEMVLMKEGAGHGTVTNPVTFDQITPEHWTLYLSQWKALKAHDEAVAAKAEAGDDSTLVDDGVTEDTIAGVARMCLTKKDLTMVIGHFMASEAGS